MFTVDAVYALAHALHNMYAERCGSVPFAECESMHPAPLGTDLLKYIHNVSFYGRQNTQVKTKLLMHVTREIFISRAWEIRFCVFLFFFNQRKNL